MKQLLRNLTYAGLLVFLLSDFLVAQNISATGNIALGGDSAGTNGILHISVASKIDGPLMVLIKDDHNADVPQASALPLLVTLPRNRNLVKVSFRLASSGRTHITVRDTNDSAETVTVIWEVDKDYDLPPTTSVSSFPQSTVRPALSSKLWAQADRIVDKPQAANIKIHIDNSLGGYEILVTNEKGIVVDRQRYEVARGAGTDFLAQTRLDAGKNTITVTAPGTKESAIIDVPAMTASFSAPERANVDPPEYDWGRVRGYFASGVVFSKERDNFSKTDIFLDFTLDKTYLAKPFGPFKNLNTFFDARLTSIPVTAGPAASPSPSPSASPCNTADCVAFITSRKAAMMQAGIYLPMYWNFTMWNREVPRIGRAARWETNALFIAPLAKGGVLTTTGQQTAEARKFGKDDVFNFYSFGAMIGHFRLHGRWEGSNHFLPNRDIGPELISWLVITYGRWENFEIETPTGTKDAMGNDILWRQRPYRWEALGRLKIPETPFLIGFDGNFGKGPDDVRFIFGTRFDIGKILRTLKIASAQDTLGQAPSPQ